MLVEDIRRGLAAKVFVYKLDRISRSILDFANQNGGRTPYGFRTEPIIIDGIHTKKLVIEPTETTLDIYEFFRSQGTDILTYLPRSAALNRTA